MGCGCVRPMERGLTLRVLMGLVVIAFEAIEEDWGSSAQLLVERHKTLALAAWTL